MKSDPGASYECPLVLEENEKKRPAAAVAGYTPVICIDSDSDEDCKPAAKPSKRARTPQLLNPSGSSSTSDNNDSSDDAADAALARQLQEQEWASRVSKQDGSPMSIDDSPPTNTQGGLLATALHTPDNDLNQLAMQSDASLAARLQQEEHQHKNQRVEAEQRAMSKSLDGRAWLFVNQVLDLHKRLSTTAPGLETVAVDDMVYLGKNFLQCIQDFEQNTWPASVTLAYHYTRSKRMDSIKQDGLMTLADRKKTYSNSHGVGVFGDGVYTATNPFAFRHFGDVGLLVAVVLGHSSRVAYNSKAMTDVAGINTKIGNKALNRINGRITDAQKYTDELVLRESKQCLPLMRFDTASVSSQAGQDAVWMYHQELQRLLDSTFNKNVPTKVTRIHESSTDPYRIGGSAAARLAAAQLAASVPAVAQMAALGGRSAAFASNAASRSARRSRRTGSSQPLPGSNLATSAVIGGPATAASFPAPSAGMHGTNVAGPPQVAGAPPVPAWMHGTNAAGPPQVASAFGGTFFPTTSTSTARRSRQTASKSAGSSAAGPPQAARAFGGTFFPTTSTSTTRRSRQTASKSAGSSAAGPPQVASAFGGTFFPTTSTSTTRRSRQTASKSAGSSQPLPGSNLSTSAMIGGPATASSFPASAFSAGIPGAHVASLPQVVRVPSMSRRSRRATHTAYSPSSSRRRSEVIQYTAPQALSAPSSTDAFETCSKESKEDCVICMESLAKGGRAVSLKECGHEYHKQCIKGALKSSNKCPVCRTLISKPQGHCPSGTMRISSSRSTHCSGFENCGSIIIQYDIPSGTQLSFHENPGHRYHGATRVAYLPDNEEGRKLLERLVFAWKHGLTFTVGTSLTSRKPNCVTWASIHHKTSPTGGQHGFPDLGYFLNAHGELDAAGVPK